MDVEGEALPSQPTDRRETQISTTLPIWSTPFSFVSWLSNLIVTFVHSIKPNDNPALSAQHSDHLPIETKLPTRSSSSSSVGSRNRDQGLHHASFSFTSSHYYQNHYIPSSSSSSSFNYSPPKNTRPKRRREFKPFHCGEVGGRRGYTDSTSPPPNQAQSQNNTNLVLPPIINIFREQELAKLTFSLTVPIIAAVINLYNRPTHPPPPGLLATILGLVLFGIPVLWSGLLLKETNPTISVALELLGSYSVILALVVLVACVVPGVPRPWLIADSVFCFCVCLVPFFVALCHIKN